MSEPYRAGYVAVVGRPNVGKSTLVNALVGVDISIVSSKPQTTRHRVLGIATSEAGQLALVDTPGLHQGQGSAMSRYLNRAARGSVADVNAALLVVAAGRWHDEDTLAYDALAQANVPCVLAINKIDLLKDKATLLPFITEHVQIRDFAAVHPISALRNKGLDALRNTLLQLMPESEPLFGEDEITDRSERFLAAELVREQLMRRVGDEVPYALTVQVERFEVDGAMLRIAVVVWVERENHKPIVIGKGGERMKAVASVARGNMEKLFGRKVFLEVWCKVREGWADDDAALRRFGYSE
jgi:GTP-binding protein Era